MQLAEPARLQLCGLARMEERELRPLEPELDAQRLIERLDGSLRAR